MTKKSLPNLNSCELQILLNRVELKLDWGGSSEWSSYDYDKLSSLIFEVTKVSISSNTLKRVWGRIKYDSNPSMLTLNTLAQFIGQEDFTDFKTELNKSQTKNRIKPFTLKLPVELFNKKYVIASFIVFFISIICYTTGEPLLQVDLDKNDFYFNGEKITVGIPNSVLFKYNAKDNSNIEKLEIQQSWDERRRRVVSKTDSLASFIYNRPGYFVAKLIANDQVVKEHELLIESEGWQGFVDIGNDTYQFNNEDVFDDNRVSVDFFLSNNKMMIPESDLPETSFYYVNEFPGLDLNDFILETKLNNTMIHSLNSCQNTSVILLFQDSVVIIPLTNLGCIGDIELRYMDKLISSRNSDLSGFGVDFSEGPVSLKCESDNGLFSIWVNGKNIIELPIKKSGNEFNGFIFNFDGAGQINSLLLKNKKETYLEF